MNLLQFSRHENGPDRRLQFHRRPMVENLEGRRLLAGIVGDPIGCAIIQTVGTHPGDGARDGRAKGPRG